MEAHTLYSVLSGVSPGFAKPWSGLAAEGEYFDFGSFDLAAADAGASKPQTPHNFRKNILSGNAEISLLQDAAQSGSNLQGRFWSFSKLKSAPSDRYVNWHANNLSGGFVVFVPDGGSASAELEIIAGGHSAFHNLIILGRGASLELSLRFSGKPGDSPLLHTDFIECFVGDDSTLQLATVQDYPISDWSIAHAFVRLGRFSKSTHLAGNFGAAASRLRIQNHLEGSHSSAHSLQAFFSRGSQFSDVEAATYHHVPDTTGMMKAKGALNGSSRCAYKGYIKVGEGASNTITHQSGTALLLSGQSSANVMPALDVENNEVEAGHGAAVGELSEEEMLYLRSRGLDSDSARSLIVDGYFKELLGQCKSSLCRGAVAAPLLQLIDGVKNRA